MKIFNMTILLIIGSFVYGTDQISNNDQEIKDQVINELAEKFFDEFRSFNEYKNQDKNIDTCTIQEVKDFFKQVDMLPFPDDGKVYFKEIFHFQKASSPEIMYSKIPLFLKGSSIKKDIMKILLIDKAYICLAELKNKEKLLPMNNSDEKFIQKSKVFAFIFTQEYQKFHCEQIKKEVKSQTVDTF